jgi:hypothetical protein
VSDYLAKQAALYQAPLSEFVAERKRLSAELKAAGDKDGAARLAKLPRPTASAWTVNQLWWHEQQAFEELLQAAAAVKIGDREAGARHKAALNRLKELATELLQASGNAATETTLRRVTTTLSAIAASGGFAPDAPGTLGADRDPPGFEALGFVSEASAHPAPATPAAPDRAAERAAEAERRRTEEAERQRRVAERERLSTALEEARALEATQQRDLSRLRGELETAERGLKETRALLAQIEQQLASL